MFDFIHVGYWRCASTLLQQIIFPSLEEVHAVSKRFTNAIVFQDDLFYDHDAVAAGIAQEARPGKIYVYSDENLLSAPLFSHVPERLARLAPEAEIIVVLRNQTDMLHSLYKLNLRAGYGFSPRRFLDVFCDTGILAMLDYETIIRLYERHFKKVHVLLFERLVGEKRIDDLLRPLGLPLDALDATAIYSHKVNAAHSTAAAVKLNLLHNRFCKTKLQMFDGAYQYHKKPHTRALEKFLSRFTKTPFHFSEKLCRGIVERFQEANATLQARFDFDLEPYGYIQRRPEIG